METAKITVKDSKYDLLQLPEYFTTLEIGKPQLPAIRELLAVCDFTNYKFSIVDSSVTILKEYNVYPFQTPALEGEKLEFVKDELFYEKDTFFPEKIIDLEKPGIWRDLKVSRLSIFPIKYNPKIKTLKIFTRLVIKIDFENSSGNALIRNKPIPNEWKNMYKNSILNYDYLHLDRMELNKNNRSNSSSGDYDYLIITHQDYYSDIQRMASWKTRKGLLSKVVKLNDIGGNNSTSIKNYITSEYNNHNISYVLLVGDVSQLCMIYTGNDYGSGDFQYSLLSGDDYRAEIAIGRFSAISSAEVLHVSEKNIRYETTPPISNWVRKALLVANWQNAPGKYQGCKEEIRTYPYSDPPIFTTAYGASTSNGGDEATNSDVTSYINSGFGVVNYRGHGSATAWAGTSGWTGWNMFHEYYTTSIARNLNNGDMAPIVFSIACTNSQLHYGSECLAEAFTKADDAATAFLGGTRSTYTYANHTYDEELFKNTFSTAVNDIGNISNDAAVIMVRDHGISGKKNAIRYLWLGEPALEVWTNTIQQYANVQITDNGSSITVNSGISGSDICLSSSNNGDNYHEVETNTSSHTFTGISSSDRPLYITVTKHNYVPYTAVTGGTLTTNQYWFGKLNVLDDITVASNATLTIDPGSTIKSGDNVTIDIDGRLNAEGTSSNPIKFTSLYTSPSESQYWFAIGFDYGSSNNSTLKYCTFEYSEYGAWIRSNMIVDHCTFNNNRFAGTIIQDAVPQIKNSEFSNNRHGIELFSTNYVTGRTLIQNNEIHHNSSYGIYFQSSSPLVLDNEVYNNTRGFYCNSNSSPYLGDFGAYGNNDFYSNTYGIYAYLNSNPFLGEEYCSEKGGHNKITSSSSYHVYANSNCNITAEENWWGSNPPSSSKFYSAYGSSIDYTPWLTSPPSFNMSLSLSLEESIFDESFPNNNSSNTDFSSVDVMANFNSEWPLMRKLLFARSIIYLDHQKDAQKICEDILNMYPDSSLAFFALDIHWEAYRTNNDINSFINYLNSLTSKKEKKELYGSAELILAGYNKGKSVDIYDKVADSYSGTWLEEQALYLKFTHYLYDVGDEDQARKICSEIDSKFPESESSNNCHSHLGEDLSNPKKSVTLALENNTPTEFKLFNNSPNPFNPVTRIKYALPNISNVNFSIYNSLGQKIKSVLKLQQISGYHFFTWDATNNNGLKVPSGLYILRFTAKSLEDDNNIFRKSIKMLLIR